MGTRATEAIRHAARGNGEATEAGADIGSRIGSTFGSTGSAVGAAGGALAGAAVTIASRAAEFVVVDVVEGAFRSLGSVFD
jgi:phage-related tail protein